MIEDQIRAVVATMPEDVTLKITIQITPANVEQFNALIAAIAPVEEWGVIDTFAYVKLEESLSVHVTAPDREDYNLRPLPPSLVALQRISEASRKLKAQPQ